MNSPHFILHIGLPKTATTSLQQFFFDKFHEKSWNFIGVRQPRYRKQFEVYKSFLRAIEAPDKNFESACEDVIDQLKLNATNLPWLLSDEMLCIDNRLTWQIKLRRAARILAETPTTVLVTVRDPEDGLRSLWVERYNSLSEKSNSFQDFLQNSNQARIYFYHDLVERLIECFQLENLRIVPFELLDDGRFVAEIAKSISGGDPDFVLPRSNVQKKNSSGKYVSKAKNLNSVATSIVMKKLHQNSLVYKISRVVYRATGFRNWTIKIPLSGKEISPPTCELDQTEIEKARNYLRTKFEINYPSSV